MSQKGLDQWFLRQDVIDQLLQSGDNDLEGINAYADRIMMIAQTEEAEHQTLDDPFDSCLLYTSPSPRDRTRSRMPSSA